MIKSLFPDLGYTFRNFNSNQGAAVEKCLYSNPF